MEVISVPRASDRGRPLSISDLDVEERGNYETALMQLSALQDFSEEERAFFVTAADRLRTVTHKAFSAVVPQDLDLIGISLPVTGSLGTVDKVKRDEDVYSNTKAFDESPLGPAVAKALDILERVLIDRTEMASRMRIDLVTLAVLASLELGDQEAQYRCSLSLEHSIVKATFAVRGDPSQERTFGGRVDYVLVARDLTHGDDAMEAELRESPSESLLKHSPILLVVPIEAKSTTSLKNITQHYPQAAIEAATYCRTHRKSAVRGCLTDGKRWSFYVYNSQPNDQFVGTFRTTETILLLPGDPDSLDYVFRLLRYWVVNTENAIEGSFLLGSG